MKKSRQDAIREFSFTRGPLTVHNDFYNSKPKADSIIKLLNSYHDTFIQDNKYIALYGSWGSGKSRILDTVEAGVFESMYITVRFEAWRYENGTDLIYCLYDCIEEKLLKECKANKDILGAIKTLRLQLQELIEFEGKLSLDIPFTPFKGESSIKKSQATLSTYKITNRFSYKFNSLLKLFLNSVSPLTTQKKFLVLIDDLDRCEPKNVLKIIASIKHLLHSENIIYLCALDDEAVKMAISRQYGDTIFHKDYLDKIFTYSFKMPEPDKYETIINKFVYTMYFKENSEPDDKKVNEDSSQIIDLMKSIEFTNPRKIHAILKKCLYLPELAQVNAVTDGTQESYLVYQDINFSNLFMLVYLVYLHSEHYEIFEILRKPDKVHPPKNQDFSINVSESKSERIEAIDFKFPRNNIELYNCFKIPTFLESTCILQHPTFLYWLLLPLMKTELVVNDRNNFTGEKCLFPSLKQNHIKNFAGLVTGRSKNFDKDKNPSHAKFVEHVIMNYTKFTDPINFKEIIDTIYRYL